MRRLSLRLLEGELAVWRLPAESPEPTLSRGPLRSVTRTETELSVVSAIEEARGDGEAGPGWRCLAVLGPLPFDLTGVLASLAGPLAEAGVPIFVVSTHDTDYLLVRVADLERACEVLSGAGHRISLD